MKTRLLVTVSIAVSMLAVAPLSAKAACWIWKPCAKGNDYGGSGMPESQSVLPPDLPPLPPDGSVPESKRVLPPLPPAGTASTAPAGLPQKLTPPKNPVAGASPPDPAQPEAAPAAAPAPTPGTVY